MIWVLVFIAGALGLLVWVVEQSDKANKAGISRLEKKLSDLVDRINQARSEVIDLNVRFNNEIGKVRQELLKNITELAHKQADFDSSFGKELDVLTVRQRTLEKKIITNERTINLNIIGPPGKGKGSLLKRAGVTQ